MGLDVTDMGGAITPDKMNEFVKRLATTEWDHLEEPKSVLFLDELNRAAADVRGSLLTLINDHLVEDPRTKGGKRYLENFMFTIISINPAGADYNVDELDDAEYDRVFELNVLANKRSLLKHLVAQFDADLAQPKLRDELRKKLMGQKQLAVTLLSHKDFKFETLQDKAKNKDNGQRKSLSPRAFETAINFCDGTKDDLLRDWANECGASSKSMVERILRDYKDIDDKANDALKFGTESEIFSTTKPLSSRLRDRVASLGN